MKNTLIAAVVLSLAAGSALAQEVGVNTGSVGSDTSYGVRVDLANLDLPYGLDLEGTFDGTVRQNTAGLNLVARTELTDRLGAYALGGFGYQWNDNESDRGVWTYGAGLTYELTETVELDARVRSFNSFRDRSDDKALTVGLNYKF